MARELFSRKAQSEVLSKIIIILLLLALSGVAYKWGSDLVEAQGIRSETETMKVKLLELEQKITEVANSGNTSARFVDISLKHGTLLVDPGEPCSGANPEKNLIKYSISSRDKFVGSETWILTDPKNKDMLCTSSYENSTSGAIISRFVPGSDIYHSEYALWFRYLNESVSSKLFLINVSTGGTDGLLKLATGRHQLRVESAGTAEAGNYVYTKVLVSEV